MSRSEAGQGAHMRHVKHADGDTPTRGWGAASPAGINAVGVVVLVTAAWPRAAPAKAQGRGLHLSRVATEAHLVPRPLA